MSKISKFDVQTPDNLNQDIAYPEAAGYSVITGRFVYTGADGKDLGQLPDTSAVNGTMKLTTSREIITYRGDPPTTFCMKELKLKLDGVGFVSPAGKPYLVVPPTSGGGIAETGWTYTASFYDEWGNKLHEVTFKAPQGEIVDLTLVTQTKPDGGTGAQPIVAMSSTVTLSVFEAKRQAKAAADSAAGSRDAAERAETSAKKSQAASEASQAASQASQAAAESAEAKISEAEEHAAKAQEAAEFSEAKSIEAADRAEQAEEHAAEAVKTGAGATTKAGEAEAHAAEAKASAATSQAASEASAQSAASAAADLAQVKKQAASDLAEAKKHAAQAEAASQHSEQQATASAASATIAQGEVSKALATVEAAKKLLAETPVEWKCEEVEPGAGKSPQVKLFWRRYGEDEWHFGCVINSGVDGKDGDSVVGTTVGEDRHLHVTMSTGEVFDAGEVAVPPPEFTSKGVTVGDDWDFDVSQTAPGKFAIGMTAPTPAGVSRELVWDLVNKVTAERLETLDLFVKAAL